MTNDELRKQSAQDLNKQLHELFREQFNLRMQKGMGANPKPHLFTNVRRQIARLKTIIQERMSS